MARRAEAVILVLFGLPTAVIDWQIAQTWRLPVWLSLLAGMVALAGFACVLLAARIGAIATPIVVAVLYALPIVGAIVRWHFFPGKVALIGDGTMQTQIAVDFLLRGVDPYGANYAAAGLGAAPWGEPFQSPALHHLVVWPGQFLWALPLQVTGRFLGWWDSRIFLLLAAAATWMLLTQLLGAPAGRLAAAAFFLMPDHSLVAVLGDNDLVMLALVLAALLAADRGHYLLMGLLLGLAVVTKQHAVLVVPFIAAWAVVRGAGWIALGRAALVAALGGMVVLAPFVLWNDGAFVRDTIVFLMAGGVDAYPINGFGLSAFLLASGVIHGSRASFPFFVFELAIGLALWALGWRWILLNRRLADVITFSGLAFLGVLYVSRYFHDSHLVLGCGLIAAGLAARWSFRAASNVTMPQVRVA